MGYMKIRNLYKNREILLFKKIFAMEKIHGTSAHLNFSLEHSSLTFFPGGEKYDNFVKLFDKEALTTKFCELELKSNVTVYGEAFGGRCQGMSGTYGKELKFVAFDVKIGDNWLSVPQAESFVKNLGLDFVHYEEVETDIDVLDALCSADSVQAVKNGVGEGKLREGVVLRPLVEMTLNNGERIIVKHKNDAFAEREHQPKVTDPAKLKILEEASAISDEWVSEMRLVHVLDKFPDADFKDIPKIIKAMVDDIYIEAKGEIVESQEVSKAISRKTALMFKQRLKK